MLERQSDSQASHTGASLQDILRCPRCASPISGTMQSPQCSNRDCTYADGFLIASGQPVLIDFEKSVFGREMFENGREPSVRRDDVRVSFRSRIRNLLSSENYAAREKSTELVQRLAKLPGRPRILIVGGGARGSGIEHLYKNEKIELIGTDVYASPNTCIVADGHSLPFVDESFDAVWIQAVLEHVLEPAQVVSEIFRVLKQKGLVYADTPFMQQVHEGAYDFTRFSLSGHRWLFRRFEQIDAGSSVGAATSLLWSLRYFFRALGRGHKAAQFLALPFFWLKYVDFVLKGRADLDAAGGVYFFGIKSHHTIGPKEIVAYYETQSAQRARQ